MSGGPATGGFCYNDDMAPKLYGLLRKYLDTKALEAQISPPDVDVLPIDEDIGDDALFRNP